MLSINVNVPMIGRVVTLGESDVEDWSNILNKLSDMTHVFTLTYVGETQTGIIKVSEDETTLLIVFDEEIVTPSGACIIVELDCEDEDMEGGCANTPLTLSASTRLAVLDENGCLQGYVLYEDILEHINSLMPKSLCELIGQNNIPERSLVAGDKVLVTGGQCDLAAIPQQDIKCS